MHTSIEFWGKPYLRALLLSAAILLVPCATGAELSRDQAAAAASQSLGGARVLSVEKTESTGRAAWRVKLVTAAGDVSIVLLDPGGLGSSTNSPVSSGGSSVRSK